MRSTMRERLLPASTRGIIAATLFAMTAWPASPALLQAATPPPASSAPREIQIGQPVDATLHPGEPSGRYHDDYRLALNAGDAVQIDLESSDFDTFLELRLAGASGPIASNDDRGDSVNSRLIFTAASGGEYIISAGRFYSGSGRYRLTVTRVPGPPTPLALPLGRTGGDFDDRSALLPSDYGRTYRYSLYQFRGVSGQRVQIDMTSAALDSRLELLGPDNSVLVTGDDGGAQRRARLLAMIRNDAMYTLRASAPATQSGHFDIDFRQGPPAPPAPLTFLHRGAISGRFEFDSAAEPYNPTSSQLRYFYRDFALVVRANEVLTIDLESSDLDSYLEVGVMSPLGFAAVLRDDDSGDGYNSRLVLRPERSGALYVRARSFRSQTGCYTLRVTPGEPPAQASPPAGAAPPAAAAAVATPPQTCPAESAPPPSGGQP